MTASATQSERGVIGALLANHDEVFPVIQDRGITAASFTDSLCIRTWEVMALLRAGKPGIVDLVTVAEAWGGDSFEAMQELESLVKDCPSIAFVGGYAERVRESERRRGLSTAARLAVEQLDNGGDIAVIAARIQDEAKAATETGCGLSVEDAADYAETEPPPIDCIIEDVFEKGDKVELVSGSKQRKTFFLVLLFIHLAIGRDFLNFRIPKRRRVMWVNLELKSDWSWRRIHRLAGAVGVSPDELRGWLLVVNARRRGREVRQQIARIAARHRVDLVGLDPRYKLHLPNETENAGEGVQGILDLMDDVAESGPAVLVVHHDPKGDAGDRAIADRGSGSSWAGRDVDARFTLTPQRDEPDTASIVETMCRNFPPVEPFVVRWQDGLFVLAPDLQPVPYTSQDRKKRQSKEATIDNSALDAIAMDVVKKEPLGRNELVEGLQRPGVSRSNARACIDRLVRVGKLAVTPRAGRKHGTVLYGLPEAIHEYLYPRLP